MKRKTLALILALMMVVSMLPTFALADEGPEVMSSPQAIIVNGENVSVEVYNINGSNYFKLRDIAKLLDGTDAQF